MKDYLLGFSIGTGRGQARVFLAGHRDLRISLNDMTWLSIISFDEHSSKVFRFPDHKTVDNPLMVIEQNVENITRERLRQIILEASQTTTNNYSQ